MAARTAAVVAFAAAGVDMVFGILHVHSNDTRFGRFATPEVCLAEADGGRGARLDHLHGLRAALAEGLASDRMTAVEVPGGVAR